MSNKNKIKELIKLMPNKKFLFYSLDEKENVVELSNKFNINGALIKFSENIKKINLISLNGIYINVLNDEYSSIVDMEKEIDFIIDFPNAPYSVKLDVRGIEFLRKVEDYYQFYISFDIGLIKKIIEDNIEKIIEDKKLELLGLAEKDEITTN